MKCLTAAEIFAAPKSKPVWVPIPEWQSNGEAVGVYVRPLKAAEVDELQFVLATEGKDDHNYRGRVVALCACDADGHILFTEAQAHQLADLEVGPIDRIFEAAERLNRLTEKSREEVAKNSVKAPANGSSSASPGTSAKPSRS